MYGRHVGSVIIVLGSGFGMGFAQSTAPNDPFKNIRPPAAEQKNPSETTSPSAPQAPIEAREKIFVAGIIASNNNVGAVFVRENGVITRLQMGQVLETFEVDRILPNIVVLKDLETGQLRRLKVGESL